MSATGAPGGRIPAAAAMAIVAAIAVISFIAVWLAFPGQNHFTALIGIGILALLYSVVSYFAQALTASPAPLRAAGWGLFGMGGAVLLLAIVLDVPSGTDVIWQLLGAVLVLVVLLIGFTGAAWRGRALGADRRREQNQAAWRSRPAASAFGYSSANPPAVAPPPTAGSPPPGPGGSP
ncbi:MAG: hypothetical protein L3K04_04530 [Thermoplasmata archaeon]|nr:hypothetical protein [Thermoplasmata archaeon]MCI4342335.1 hypothetical protein [Thermoplasmata archaeon]